MSSSSVDCCRFSLGEIEDAKAKPEEILGRGGEGKVYMGQISAIGKVAIKCLESNFIKFEEEIEIVSKMKHPHLVSLHGYCAESGHKILVYEYMEKGSLSNYISTKKSRRTICLTWQQRLNICLGAARGLQYLHRETEEFPKGVTHRDIKPDNILLDNNWVAKISDFGLCKISYAGQNKSTMITGVKGTRGYFAPEYLNSSGITRKVDVYAFGVVLFEVLCRKMPWDRGDESYYGSENEDLGLWARENVDPEIKEELSEACLEAFTHIIGRSLLQDSSRRPTMDDVVMDLEGAIKCQERQDEGVHPKAATSGRKVSIPGSVRKMIHDIKSITKNSEDEIYAMLKECSMDPIQTIQKLLIEVRISNETTADIPESTSELPESSNAVALDNDRHIIMSVEEMEAFCQNLKEATNDLEGSSFHHILKDTDRLVACLTTTVAKFFHSGLASESLRSCKYALHTLMQIFNYKLLAHDVKESTLDGLLKELLIWIVDERLHGLDDDIANKLMLKILDNAERTSSFVVVINLFRPLDPSIWPYSHEANSRRFYRLVIQCLIKLTKDLKSTINGVNFDRLLQSIHVYLEELGMDEIRRRTREKPLRMVKYFLYELVKLRGAAVKGDLSMVPIHKKPQPIILAYIDFNLQMVAAGRGIYPGQPKASALA